MGVGGQAHPPHPKSVSQVFQLHIALARGKRGDPFPGGVCVMCEVKGLW